MDEERTMSPQKPVVGTQKMLIPIAIVIAGVLIAGSLLYINRGTLGSTPTSETPTAQNIDIRPIDSTDHILGNPNAPIVIVEYSDTECPYCKEFHSTMRQIMDTYGEKGQVAWVYRHFPIAELHPKAIKEAVATECAAELGGNDAFWKFTNRLYEITPANNGLDLARLPELAKEVGLNVTAFNTCLESTKHNARIEADFNEAVKAGGRGTPFSIILAGGQKTPMSGAYPYPALKSVIDTILPKVAN